MSLKRALDPLLTCIVCGDEIVIAAEFTAKGAVCADCADQPIDDLTPDPMLHENGRPATAVPSTTPTVGRAAGVEATNPDSPVCTGAGDRGTDPSGRLPFRPPTHAQQLSLSVEEWLYGPAESVVVSTPHELNTVAALAGEMFRRHAGKAREDFYRVRFVVVLEWLARPEQFAPYRDIGPSFGGFYGAANDWAKGEAKRLKAVPPMGYRSAREIY